MGVRELLSSLGWLMRSFFSLFVVFIFFPALLIGWILLAKSLDAQYFPLGVLIIVLPFVLLLIFHLKGKYSQIETEKDKSNASWQKFHGSMKSAEYEITADGTKYTRIK